MAFFVSLAFVAAADPLVHGAELVDAGDVSLGRRVHGRLVGSLPEQAGKGGCSIEGPMPGFEVDHAGGLLWCSVGGFDECPGSIGRDVEVGAELIGGGGGLTPIAAQELAQEADLFGPVAADLLFLGPDLVDEFPVPGEGEFPFYRVEHTFDDTGRV